MGAGLGEPWRAMLRRAALAAAICVMAPLAAVIVSQAPAGAAQVSNVTVAVSPAAAGYPTGCKANCNLSYSISFTATSGLNNNGPGAPVTIEGPTGTVFDQCCGGNIVDDTNPLHTANGCGGGEGPAANIYTLGGDCGLDIPAGDRVTVEIGGTTNPSVASNNYKLQVETSNDPTLVTSAPYSILNEGYWLVGSDGGIFSFGAANFYGSTGSLHLQRPVVGIVTTADHGGYWLDASDGGVFSFGDTSFYGSIPGLGISPAGSGGAHSLQAPIVGMVPSSDDHGYFMVASDGGVFAFGDAAFAGSCYSIGGCSGSAVSVMPDASGHGYWLVTTTGAVYGFGDAPFLGAPGNTGAPVTAAVRTPDGKGYWVLDAAGDVHGYGDAANLGNVTTDGYFSGITGAIWTDSFGDGYGVSALNGAIKTFGGVPNYGGMSGTNLNGSIIAASGF
jgi:hypothetical protein